jgi:hypothetical protein
MHGRYTICGERCAAEWARLGVPIHVIEKCVNHVSGTLSGVAGIYNRYSYETEKREAMQKWGDHIASLVLELVRKYQPTAAVHSKADVWRMT